jgi:hypothetical protein
MGLLIKLEAGGVPTYPVGYPRIFFAGVLHQEFFRGVQQIQLRIDGRENGDLGAVVP